MDQRQQTVVTSIKVVIVFSDVFVARGLSSYLSASPDIIVVEGISITRPFWHTIQEKLPNVVLIHAKLIDSTVVKACQQLEVMHPSVKCLLLLSTSDNTQFVSAVQAGAKGVLSYETMTPRELIRAIRQVYAGEVFIAPTIMQSMMKLIKCNNITMQSYSSPLSALTEREVEILSHTATGQGNRDIAKDLHIEVKTVKNHLTKIYSKLQVRCRSEAIAAYYTSGYAIHDLQLSDTAIVL